MAREASPRRRIVAALFCDTRRLNGARRADGSRGPETAPGPILRTMRTSIERHGGTVEKFIGYAVVDAFGDPDNA